MDDLLREFLTETSESLDTVDNQLVRFEQDPNNAKILDNIFRLVHTIKGTCGFLGLPRLEALAHAGETLMGKFRDGMPVTAEAVTLAKDAKAIGCSALMVLPPYVYSTDWREMKAHVSAVIAATDLPCMLYNNPVAYGTDFLPEQIQELAAEYENFEAVKESSTDARRVSAIRALLDRRLEISVGVDDAVLEAIGVGATGWVAGLANALPRESVELFNCGIHGESEKAFELYRWFLPLLRMDTVPNFVQLIKLVQAEVGIGNSRVRAPRLELVGSELEQAKKIIRDALRSRPQSVVSYALPNGK